MLPIPAEIQTLLKSKQMVGSNRPTGTVSIEGMPTGFGELAGMLNENGRIIQKNDAGGCDMVPTDISNVVWDSQGQEFFVAKDATTGKIVKGTMAKNEDYLYIDGHITQTSSIGLDLNAPDEVSDWSIWLHKRDDGKVLLFTFNGTPDVEGYIDCYISNSGDGDDFVYYSRVTDGYHNPGNAALGFMGCFQTREGTLLLNCHTGYYVGFGYWFPDTRICRSTDGGATWTVSLRAGSYYAWDGHGQMAQTEDGVIFFQRWPSSALDGVARWFFSRDDGATWDSVAYGWGDWDWVGQRVSGLYFDGPVGYMVFELGESIMVCEDVHSFEEAIVQANWHSIGASFEAVYRRAQLYRNFRNRLLLQFRTVTANDPEHAPISTYIAGFENLFNPVPIKAITVDRAKGSASQATVTLDNRLGIYDPDPPGKWNHIIWPDNIVEITLGYGAAQQLVFTGLLDDMEMTNYPAEISFTARDYSKKALDQMVQMTWENQVVYAITYQWQTLEYIFRDLAIRAGWATDHVFTDASGITLSEITFSQEAFGDAFQRLAEIASFEWFCDEIGDLYFRLSVEPAPTALYTFREGEDIFSLGYKISDAEIYAKVVVVSQDADRNTVSATADYTAAAYYHVLPKKTLIIQATDLATTAEQCAALAQKALISMNSKPRQVNFCVVGHPYLQIGDCIQVYESTSTISEIYRIFALTHQMDASGSPVFGTTIQCYHYAAG